MKVYELIQFNDKDGTIFTVRTDCQSLTEGTRKGRDGMIRNDGYFVLEKDTEGNGVRIVDASISTYNVYTISTKGIVIKVPDNVSAWARD